MYRSWYFNEVGLLEPNVCTGFGTKCVTHRMCNDAAHTRSRLSPNATQFRLVDEVIIAHGRRKGLENMLVQGYLEHKRQCSLVVVMLIRICYIRLILVSPSIEMEYGLFLGPEVANEWIDASREHRL